MLRAGRAVGAISVIRTVPGDAWTARTSNCCSTFADQAVIAIENVRLFNETKEALERQTATAEVLQVISGSMADAQPVFERILDSCERLFGTQEMGICLARDGLIDFPAYRGKFADMIKAEYPRPLAGSVSERVMFTGDVEHIPDASADDMPEYVSRLVADYANFSLASAPMLWQGQGIGTIDIARSPPRPFSDKELALLRTFADQAVVAIQNAKLFNETKVALERQTATAEILAVIADSPEDVQPVLDAIVESAKRLIGGFSATVFRVFDGMVHLAAFTATDEAGAAALHANFPAPLSSFYGFEPLRSGRVIQVEDTETNPQVTGEWRELARQRHYRANVNVPMLREGVPIGMISVTRTEPGPFAPHHVDLLAVLRRPGRDRDRERAAVQRDQGGAGASGGFCRSSEHHQRVGVRYAAGVHDDPELLPALDSRLRLCAGSAHRRTGPGAAGRAPLRPGSRRRAGRAGQAA